MNHIRVRAAHSEEHDRLVSLYLAWGYRGGVDPLDIVYVAEHSGRVVGARVDFARSRSTHQ